MRQRQKRDKFTLLRDAYRTSATCPSWVSSFFYLNQLYSFVEAIKISCLWKTRRSLIWSLFTSADVVLIVENMLIQHVFVLSSVNSCYSWCLCGHVTRILLVTVTPHLWCSVARRIDLLLATTGIYHSVIILSGAPACLRLQGVKQSSRNCRVYCFLWYLYACIFVNITLD